jgi:hypothetical protein
MNMSCRNLYLTASVVHVCTTRCCYNCRLVMQMMLQVQMRLLLLLQKPLLPLLVQPLMQQAQGGQASGGRRARSSSSSCNKIWQH